ncbi:MAG: DUF4097 family beta strand repeat-containing protein [Acidobacteria bacterium]|nr:DUF4097 family beta strand repeat-containing protein [Acidobacteriota bacterium]
MKITTTLLLALLAIPAAGATVDETRATGPNPEVSVEAILGSIRIVGWDRNEVHITGTLGSGIKDLQITGDEDEVDIEVEYHEHHRKLLDGEANLEIFVPTGSDVEIETVKGTIDIENVNGDLELQTIHGGITVIGPASLVEADTVSGDIRISGSNTDVEANSVGGSVIVIGASGDIEISTMNGAIEVDTARADSVALESMSGPIEFRGDLAAGGDLSVEAYSSHVVLVLPSTVSATFDIETQTGNIDNEFGPKPQRVDGFMPGKTLEFSLGDGSADISVESFCGNVKLVRDNG